MKAIAGVLPPVGPFDLAHVLDVVRAVESAGPRLAGCRAVDVDLAQLDRIDGAGAVLLARFLDRLDADGHHTRIVEDRNPEAARLIRLYRERHVDRPPPRHHPTRAPGEARRVRRGRARSRPPPPSISSGAAPSRCRRRSRRRARSTGARFHGCVQEIGADALLVTSAANLLVGVIIGFLGVSQLGRFGAIVYVPELVVVAHFRELGPLVTAIVVAGRSGAGLASEIATMKVSEEIDALRSMGFDPVRWLVVPRCLALVAVVPLLTWVGDVLALVGGLAATIVITDMTPRAYVLATLDHHHREPLAGRASSRARFWRSRSA